MSFLQTMFHNAPTPKSIANDSPIGCLYGWYTWMSKGLCVVFASTTLFDPSYLFPFSIVLVFQSVQKIVSSKTVRAKG